MTGSLLDVCLALLLIGAAAGTLVGAESEAAAAPDIGASSSRASETAETLAGSTAAVEYTLVSAGEEAESDGATASPEGQRVAHATLAEHLARAAVRSATVDGSAPSPTAADYRRGVRRTVADAIGANTRVRAVWRPLPCDDSDGTPRVEGTIVVGPHPPASTSVHAARFTVPVAPSSDSSESEHTNTEAAGGVAARTIAVLFPPDRIAAAERGDNTAERVVRDRYRRVGALLGVDAVEALERGGPREANRALAAALADRHAGTDPSDPAGEPNACESGDPDRVTVVVRTWSA